MKHSCLRYHVWTSFSQRPKNKQSEGAKWKQWYTRVHLSPPVYFYTGFWMIHELNPGVIAQQIYSRLPAVPHKHRYTAPCVHSCFCASETCPCNSCQIKATSSAGTWSVIKAFQRTENKECFGRFNHTLAAGTGVVLQLCYSYGYSMRYDLQLWHDLSQSILKISILYVTLVLSSAGTFAEIIKYILWVKIIIRMLS